MTNANEIKMREEFLETKLTEIRHDINPSSIRPNPGVLCEHIAFLIAELNSLRAAFRPKQVGEEMVEKVAIRLAKTSAFIKGGGDNLVVAAMFAMADMSSYRRLAKAAIAAINNCDTDHTTPLAENKEKAYGYAPKLLHDIANAQAMINRILENK